MAKTSIDLAWYQPMFDAWQVKLSGPKPTPEMFAMVHAWGYRPGFESLNVAMCLREGGATVRQFLVAGGCGGTRRCGPANNKRQAVAEGPGNPPAGGRLLCTTKKLNGGTLDPNAFAFKLTPTPKGLALAKAGMAAKADQPKGKAKPVAPNGNGKPVVAKAATAPRKPTSKRKPRPAAQVPVTTENVPAVTPAPTQGIVDSQVRGALEAADKAAGI